MTAHLLPIDQEKNTTKIIDVVVVVVVVVTVVVVLSSTKVVVVAKKLARKKSKKVVDNQPPPFIPVVSSAGKKNTTTKLLKMSPLSTELLKKKIVTGTDAIYKALLKDKYEPIIDVISLSKMEIEAYKDSEEKFPQIDEETKLDDLKVPHQKFNTFRPPRFKFNPSNISRCYELYYHIGVNEKQPYKERLRSIRNYSSYPIRDCRQKKFCFLMKKLLDPICWPLKNCTLR